MIFPIINNTIITPDILNVCVLLSGSITIKNHKENIVMCSNSFFFFNRGFEIIASSPFVDGFILKIDSDFLMDFSDLKEQAKKIEYIHDFIKIKNIENKRRLFHSILKISDNTKLKKSFLHILWNELFDDFFSRNEKKSIVVQFSELIDQHIQQNLCAGAYSKILGIPLKVLIKEVRKSENKTPCHFITEKVIEKAKYKLLNTDDSSKMIAYYLGFNDPYYFIKYFKKSTDLTPTQYRKRTK
ncbi:helix-turn-helix domain-containing protein [Tenacibaculum sp. C7A-26P2]|uniref:helix-turn-helix domain-containing protein n=1 Tax=Tenacibaculum sp. C7A-26P2 TaxID=3447504 RepID=UPI003F87BE24